MSNKHFIGKRLFSFSDNGLRDPVSRVTLLVDDEKAVTAGDDTGLELLANCPYADETLAQALLNQVKGYQYRAFNAQSADLDPAAELGDGVTADGVYSILASLTDNGDGYPDLAAPGDREEEDEYPEGGPMTRLFNRQIATTRSLIAKNSEQIQLRITNDQAESLIKQTLNDITLSVNSAKGVTSISLTGDGVSVKAENLNLSVKAANIEGTLTANQINAQGLHVNAANIDGKLTLSQMASISFEDLTDADDVRGEFGDGLTEYDMKTYINNKLLASPTIAGGVFMDYDQEVGLYLDKNVAGSHYGMILEDDAGEIFSIWSDSWSPEIAGIVLRENTLITLNDGKFMAWGKWDFSNANVTGL